MNQKKLSGNSSTGNQKKSANQACKIEMQNQSNTSKQKIKSLSYKESLEKVDLLLTKLRDDNIPIEEVQRYYLEGKDYLEHCETLLNTLEQTIIELDIKKEED